VPEGGFTDIVGIVEEDDLFAYPATQMMEGFVVAMVLEMFATLSSFAPAVPFVALTFPRFRANAMCARLLVPVIVVDAVNEPIGGFIREKTLQA
jgi:hypothetical protein